MPISPVYLLRSAKGSPLTNDEVDGTFEYLKDAIDGIDVTVTANTFTNSAELAALLSDETGSGKVVFSDSPVFTTGVYCTGAIFAVFNTVATTINFAGAATTLTIGANGCATTLQGTLSVIGDVIAYATSDISMKHNIRVIPQALVKVMALRGVTWDWNEDVRADLKKSPTTGVIAQDVEKVLPEVVATREDGTKAVNYEHMIGLLIEAIRELNDKIDRL
jgi:hypothetical protein